jgi:hypothetical protein
MVVNSPSVSQLSAFAKYARPRPPLFLFLSIILGLIYWPLVGAAILFCVKAIYTLGIKAFFQAVPFLFFELVGYGALVTLLGRWGKRLGTNTPKILSSETRMPILYLRSFSYESVDKSSAGLQDRTSQIYEKENDDEVLVFALRDEGPLITIGKPGDKIPPLGALRLYFKNEEWQEQVEMLMSISQFSIIQAGYTEGTDWEIQRCRNLLPPEKVIFSFLSWLKLDREARRLEYDLFAIQIKRIYGCALPENIGNASFLYFDKEWKPHLVGLAGWKRIFFWIYSIPSLFWQSVYKIYTPTSGVRGINKLWVELLRRLPFPRMLRGYSVPGVRETLRPILAESGIRLSIWRTAAFVSLVTILGALILKEMQGCCFIVLVVPALGLLARDYLQEVKGPPKSNLEKVYLFGPATLNARSKISEVAGHETKYKKCLNCGLGNWYEATTCERCGRLLEST